MEKFLKKEQSLILNKSVQTHETNLFGKYCILVLSNASIVCSGEELSLIIYNASSYRVATKLHTPLASISCLVEKQGLLIGGS